jgi:hypothetical protein
MQVMIALSFNFLAVISNVGESIGIVPTSVAIKESARLAADLGYATSDQSIFFDQSAARQRYIVINMYRHEHILYSFSINQDTGQIVDGTRCLLFDTTSAKRFERYQQMLTRHRPYTVVELARSVGCDTLLPASKRHLRR